MKTAYLKELGITDQSVIDAIMAENGRDIERVKRNNESVQAEIDGLKAQIAERDGQLKDLKKAVGDNEALTTKLAELEEANKTAKTEYEGKLEALRKENELEMKLRDAKAKNVKAVKALINPEEDLDKQIKGLVAGEDTSFLFESATQSTPPKGTEPAGGNINPPKAEPMTLVDAVRGAIFK